MSLNLEDYAGQKEFPVVDGGTYEMVISAKVQPTKDNTSDYLNIGFKIRDDIDQKFAGSYVFEKLFRDKNNPEWYDLTKSGNILVTQKGKPGYKTKFDEVAEFVQYINGITLVVTVEKAYDDYFQKEVNSIKYLSYKPSQLGPYVDPKANGNDAKPAEGEIKAKNVEKLEIPDSELPF